MRTAAIMLQGTGSDVGKSLVTAGLCRILSRRGLAVRPFKPQNMSNNAAVTPDGGEIGRAQALQARACGVAPSVHMNPVLLKPQSDKGSQVILQGRLHGNTEARRYWNGRDTLMPAVLESFTRISDEADVVVVEGAGSPAEVNLRAGDIANMGFAEAADMPVALIGDIDRGGVIASLVGTVALLPPLERARIKGFIVNKFRGDMSLFDEGVAIIERETAIGSLGILPFLPGLHRLPAEDAVVLERPANDRGGKSIRVAVPVLPRIANFDDLDPLIAEPDVEVRFIGPGEPLPGDSDLFVLPGSKASLADLIFMRDQAWDQDIYAHLRRGGFILGLCGGYQMLGQSLSDPGGIEGDSGSQPGLGLLDLKTSLEEGKRLVEVSGRDPVSGAALHGYEMHVGRTAGPGLERPFLELAGRPEGAVSSDGRVFGTYLHGLFASDPFRHAFMSRIRQRFEGGLSYELEVERLLDAWEDHLEAHLDIDRIWSIAESRKRTTGPQS